MTKDELRRLAAAGARLELAALERQCTTLHKEFPDLFIDGAAPMFLKAEARARGNGFHPGMQRSLEELAEAGASGWTAARRAAYSKRMKAQQKMLQKARGLTPAQRRRNDRERKRKDRERKRAEYARNKKAGKKTAAPVRGRGKGWQLRWYQRLKAVGAERLKDSVEAIGVRNAATLLTGAKTYLQAGHIKKIGPGTYDVGTTPPEA